MPAPDPLTEPFAGLCGALRDLHGQVEALVRVHESIDAFNAAFGAFQDAMALHASCLQFPRKASPAASRLAAKKVSLPPAADVSKPLATGIPLPQATSIPKPPSVSPAAASARNSSAPRAAGDKSGGGPRRPAAAMKKKGIKVAAGGGHKIQQRGVKKKAPTPPAWTWEKWILEKVPKKYQSPQEIKKLENIILYIKNRGGGISIADLVKHSGLAVIKCKEILQTLMKLDIIERKHEESGFVYTFGRSS